MMQSNMLSPLSAHRSSHGNPPAVQEAPNGMLPPTAPVYKAPIQGAIIANNEAESPTSVDALKPSNHSMTHKKRNSLVGFDPLLDSERAVSPSISPKGDHPKAPSSFVAAQGLSPRNFAGSNVQGLTLEQLSSHNNGTVQEQRVQSRDVSPKPQEQERRSPSSPLAGAFSKSTMASILRSPKVLSKSSHHDTVKDKKTETSGSVTPPRMRMMPWNKKGHRRTKSLEVKEVPSLGTDVSACPATTYTKRQTIGGRSDSSDSFVNDMMALSLDTLQMPSLAKPSPTSFLIGREDEVVRTCEYEAAPFQLELPSLSEVLVFARLNEFVENYRNIDQNFELQQWKNLTRMQLRQVNRPEHVPIAQLLLDCGDDVSVKGVVEVGPSADDRLDVVIFEGQRHIIAVFRGTTEQQQKPTSGKFHKKSAPLSADNPNIQVYQGFLEEYQQLEQKSFALLDKLVEEQPFCDVVFTGYSCGAALATIGAMRYANARPMVRVHCYPMASPKVGTPEFRQKGNSSPNLRLVRLEYGQDGKCQLPANGGAHAGHTLVLHGSLCHNFSKTKSQAVVAYRFDAPKQKKFKTTYPDLRSYVAALEEIARLKLPWAQEFVGTSGQGVMVNNEARLVV
eukprot:Nitzschia sp. Nitz4//scaffold34_size148208//102742//104601//NITZ4_002989-RA/size148208-processed-gene-0.50-mRNA-1//1//CDS//3329548822//8793//frame0